MNEGRFHLTLTFDGQPAMHGWWAVRKTADAKTEEWVGDYGRPGVRVTLVDEETGALLTSWPEEP